MYSSTLLDKNQLFNPKIQHFRNFPPFKNFSKYNLNMKNLKEKNIKKIIWLMQRQCVQLAELSDTAGIKSELFHLQSSINCLNRILNDQYPYPGIDRDEVF